ncbi:MAG: ATP-dependent DNA ligase [Candidatus Diapherotrites archaeon]|uniref:DNA ligase n=1 Tax=Candidatus Iainarchaeum sp. TaxID=3101447 RepID=A0A7K4BYZ1_9ARCH|nr:ATP-dependent DNA ligase [Candidatus Diapherotrites archaeon]
MLFKIVANCFDKIENTPSRLTTTDFLVELFENTDSEDTKKIVYLLQGRIAPQFEGKEIGFGEKLIIEGIVKASGYKKEEVEKNYKKTGDLGETAQKLIEEKKQNTLFTQELSLEKVFQNLEKMSILEGTGSQEQKKKLLAELFNYATPIEAKYIARIPLGSIRLGVGDPTIMDAFAIILAKQENKNYLEKSEEERRKIKIELREKIENAYNVDSDLGELCKILQEKGIKGLKEIKIKPGKPIRPTAAERLPNAKEIIEKLGKCAVEAKYDGFRLQLSKDGEKIKIFSRQSEDITQMFPEIIEAAQKEIKAKTCIIEGEALAFNESTQEYYPFQITIQRKRKYEIEKKAQEYPLKLFLFDVMYADGINYMEKPLIERRKKLETLVKEENEIIKLSEYIITDSATELENFFEEKISQGLEGIIAKDLSAPYIAGARKFAWIKLKRSYKGNLNDTLDLVIIGYYKGKGKRTEFGLGALLVATYNNTNDTFESVAKIGTGMSEADLTELKELLTKIVTKNKNPRIVSEIEPDYFVEPKYIIEVNADEITKSPMHTCGKTKTETGYALRFPRMLKLRIDKKAEEATTSKEVKKLHAMQKKVSLEMKDYLKKE